MIVAFDGNVFAGKTTLIRRLARSGSFAVVREYPHFVNKLAESEEVPSAFREHYRYLLADSLRQKEMPKKNILLDRSFVSLSAHVYALHEIGKADLRKEHLAALKKLLDDGKIIIPNRYVFVDSPYETVKSRFLQDRQSKRSKKTPDVFVRRDYFRAINKFNRLWQKNISSGVVLGECDGQRDDIKKISVALCEGHDTLLSDRKIIKIVEDIFSTV